MPSFDRFFVIVGAPKSGTTAMTHYLRSHPDVFMPPKKELHFFGSDLHKSDRYPQHIEDYLAWFKDAPADALCGEASVTYLYSRSAAREIKDFCEATKIIIMLRDPVETMYAFHSQLLYGGFEDLADFGAALAAEEDRKNGRKIPAGAHIIENLYYREIVKFHDQILRYYDVFGKESVAVIFYEDFKEHTSKIYREMLLFLDIASDFSPNLTVINPNKRLRSRAIQYALDNFPAIIPPALRWRLHRFNTVYQQRTPMNDGLRQQLRAEYAPEIERLSKLLDRDLTHWMKK